MSSKRMVGLLPGEQLLLNLIASPWNSQIILMINTSVNSSSDLTSILM